MTTYKVTYGGCAVTVWAINQEQALSEGLAKLRRQGVPIPARCQSQATVCRAD